LTSELNDFNDLNGFNGFNDRLISGEDNFNDKLNTAPSASLTYAIHLFLNLVHFFSLFSRIGVKLPLFLPNGNPRTTVALSNIGTIFASINTERIDRSRSHNFPNIQEFGAHAQLARFLQAHFGVATDAQGWDATCDKPVDVEWFFGECKERNLQ